MDTERVAKRGCSRLGVHRFLSMSFWPFIVVGLLMFPHTLCPGLYLFITALSSFCRNCLVSCPVRSLLFSKWLLWEKGTAEKKWKKANKESRDYSKIWPQAVIKQKPHSRSQSTSLGGWVSGVFAQWLLDIVMALPLAMTLISPFLFIFLFSRTNVNERVYDIMNSICTILLPM